MKGWKKAALVAVATAPIGLAILAFVFMVRSELAFDEATCPFVETEVREVGAWVDEDAQDDAQAEAQTEGEGDAQADEDAEAPDADVRIREEQRTCQPGVEEHRWVVIRAGEPELAIGQRRLQAEYWRGYTWSASLREGHVRLEIHDASQDDPRVFNERRPDAGT